MKLKTHLRHQDSPKFSSNDVPKQLTFLSYQEEQKQVVEEKEKQSASQDMQPANRSQTFSPEERQNLKNAFRYICRLCFKESRNYEDQITKIFQRGHLGSIINSQIVDNIMAMADDAQTISGERYFKHYLQHLPERNQIIVLEYMIWFLKHKYLRYIKNTNNQKGKRKAMKKQLYLRFKNEVMLPYLDNLLEMKSL